MKQMKITQKMKKVASKVVQFVGTTVTVIKESVKAVVKPTTVEACDKEGKLRLKAKGAEMRRRALAGTERFKQLIAGKQTNYFRNMLQFVKERCTYNVLMKHNLGVAWSIPGGGCLHEEVTYLHRPVNDMKKRRYHTDGKVIYLHTIYHTEVMNQVQHKATPFVSKVVALRQRAPTHVQCKYTSKKRGTGT